MWSYCTNLAELLHPPVRLCAGNNLSAAVDTCIAISEECNDESNRRAMADRGSVVNSLTKSDSGREAASAEDDFDIKAACDEIRRWIKAERERGREREGGPEA